MAKKKKVSKIKTYNLVKAIYSKPTIHDSQWENTGSILLKIKNMSEILKIIVSIQLWTIGPSQRKTIKRNSSTCPLAYTRMLFPALFAISSNWKDKPKMQMLFNLLT